jgi:hypothetical protein
MDAVSSPLNWHKMRYIFGLFSISNCQLSIVDLKSKTCGELVKSIRNRNLSILKFGASTQGLGVDRYCFVIPFSEDVRQGLYGNVDGEVASLL